MVADGRLRETKRLDEMADARFGIRLACDEAQESKPRGVSDRLEGRGKLFGLVSTEARLKHRGAARGGFCLHRHAPILTLVDTVCKGIDIRQYRRSIRMAQNTFHVALYVKDLDAAVARYRKLLGLEPAKVRHDYAKFEISDPPVILSLNTGGVPGTVSHLGIRYPGTGDVASEMVRVKQAGEVELLEQKGTTCCYAKADKFWARDADGMPWEMYTLLADADAETAADPALRSFLNQPDATTRGACC